MTTSDEEIPVLPGKITVSLAAERLELSRQTVHEMAKDGRLTAWRVPSAAQDPVIVDEQQVTLMAAQKRNQVVEVP